MAPRVFNLLTAFFSLAPLGTLAGPIGNIPTLPDSEPHISTFISNFGAQNIVPNSYIVVYNNTFSHEEIDAHEASIKTTIQKRNLSKRDATGRLLSTRVRSFSMGNGWRAMALESDNTMAAHINSLDVVSYVEANQYVHASTLLAQVNAPPGLIRLSHRTPGGESYVFDESAGTGITAYVVDTGIRTTHQEFQGRATMVYNSVQGSPDTDENGHGSHVAGTIGGATFGVAKNVRLFGVKVLGANGGGSGADILEGLDFVESDVREKNLQGKAVVNMSLGGGRSETTNQVMEALVAAGIVPVVAAGNDAKDAVSSSPASAPDAITVGALDATNDERASFSNFGPLVDIYAPGIDVLSVGIKNDQDQRSLSGTSMSSPHVAGLAAYLMSLEGLTDAKAVSKRMKQLAAASGASVGKNVMNTTNAIANNGQL
ncbi:protease [Xylaria nigripes]|nr:protease [Xylaria nigripes]